MPKRTVQIELSVAEDADLTSIEPLVVSAAMAEEIKRFNEWLVSKNAMPVIGVEASILRNYIGWKLIDEKAGQSTPST